MRTMATPNAPKTFGTKIDRTTYKVDEPILTGAQLRALPNPPIGPDRDLFEVVPGGSDLKIEADSRVEMRNGLRFFTAPAQIKSRPRLRGPVRCRLLLGGVRDARRRARDGSRMAHRVRAATARPPVFLIRSGTASSCSTSAAAARALPARAKT